MSDPEPCPGYSMVSGRCVRRAGHEPPCDHQNGRAALAWLEARTKELEQERTGEGDK